MAAVSGKLFLIMIFWNLWIIGSPVGEGIYCPHSAGNVHFLLYVHNKQIKKATPAREWPFLLEIRLALQSIINRDDHVLDQNHCNLSNRRSIGLDAVLYLVVPLELTLMVLNQIVVNFLR